MLQVSIIGRNTQILYTTRGRGGCFKLVSLGETLRSFIQQEGGEGASSLYHWEKHSDFFIQQEGGEGASSLYHWEKHSDPLYNKREGRVLQVCIIGRNIQILYTTRGRGGCFKLVSLGETFRSFIQQEGAEVASR